MFMLDGYSISELVQQHGRFSIYKAQRNSDQLNVILKVCHSEKSNLSDLVALQHEYQILKQLNLSGIIRVYDLIKLKNSLVLVLEDTDAITLKEFLAKAPLGLSAFFRIAIQLVDAISELHLQKIIHKDINPDNILINEKSLKIKLADFSISSEIENENNENHSLLNLGQSLAYISPEQTGRINRFIDYRTDFYSLGITFYEMLTGTLPFNSDHAMELLHSHLTVLPPPLTSFDPNIPSMVEEIVNKLLAKIPEERYKSAIGLKTDLLVCQKQWEKFKKIDKFPIAHEDIQDHLIVSQRLYGREEQLDILLNKYDNVCNGKNELVFVSGYSGIGKTSLVKELYRPVVLKQGYFLSGKFDQLQRATPYSAIIEAFSIFIRHILTEPEAQLSILNSALRRALGNNGRVITNIIPDIELIIGLQPPIQDLPPAETQNRLTSTFLDFVRALVQSRHPLVLFLDDLQWIDGASLKLLQLIIEDTDLHGILIIGAYRDNEVLANHPLILMQQQLRKDDIRFTQLLLSPLKGKDIQRLISDSLASSQSEIPELVDLIMLKTQGNPFFINEFLRKLYQDKLLRFSYDKRRWIWDIEKIKELPITDNVIDLLISRIDKLPEKTQNLLELAACIGHTFDISTLSIICEQSLAETAKLMLQATKASFIVPVNGDYHLFEIIAAENVDVSQFEDLTKYRFIHDKIQQAAYQMIPSEIKCQVHLKIGRLLLSKIHLSEADDRLFDILNHFNFSINDIDDEKEKLKLAQYNLWAGRKAKMSIAYQSAKEYIHCGLKMLEKIDENIKYDLQFSLIKELAVCQYLTGEYEEAEHNFNKLLVSAKEPLVTMEVYKLNCEMLSTLNRHEEALQLGLKFLATVNIKIPAKPNFFHILIAIFRIKLLVGSRQIEKINLPAMESKKYQVIVELISQLFDSAFVTNQNLFTLLACTGVQLSLRYGYTNSTGFSCIVYAFVIMHGLNRYDEGLAFYMLYNQLAKEHPQLNVQGKSEFVIGGFIDPWRSPWKQSMDMLGKARQDLYDSGDLVYSNYTNLLMFYYSFMMGHSLAEAKIYLQNMINFAKKIKAKDFSALMEFWYYVIQCLGGEQNFKFDELARHEENIMAHKNKTQICYFHCTATKICYLLGFYKEAVYHGQLYSRYSRYALGMAVTVEGCFYSSLAILAVPDQAKRSARLLKKNRTQLQRWATWCPDNYQCYLLLLDAEMAGAKNDFLPAINHYTQAIKLASMKNINNLFALANELLGRLYAKMPSQEVVQLYYKYSRDAYLQLGYTAKVKLMEKENIETLFGLEEPVSLKHAHENNINSIDMLSLMKSSQVISSEIELDKLLHNLLIILLQNAGAHRVLLLSKENNVWYVEAEGTISEQRISLSHIEQFENRNDLPLTLIRYVQRTKKPVLIQTHQDLENFSENDAYIQMTKPQSILVMPVFYHGDLKSILYLENRSISQAFKNEHVHILQILSSQAAISLQNARLYYQATHDLLTGLANRNLLYQIFNLMIKKSDRDHINIAFLIIDLDFFKTINDTLGHHVGDKVLIYISNLLRSCLHNENIAARLGGDEFVAMVEYKDIKEISHIAENFLSRMAGAISIENHEIYLTASIGISFFPHDGNNITELLREADMALYRAKIKGKNQFQFYTSTLHNIIKQEYMQEIELRNALEKQEFCVYYQPVFSAKDNSVTHFEALLRWNHPVNGLTVAKHFITTAEKTGLIIPLGRWVLKAVLDQINQWIALGVKPIPIAVNVSGLQFKMQTVNEIVYELLQQSKVDVSYLELEFTESVSIEYTEKVMDDIAKLKSLGVKLTLDDFGTYYSSLTYLRQNIVDKIKIDQTFVKGIHGGTSDRELIIAIIDLAHSLNLNVIAEGVENKDQLEFLVANGVDELQGYYLGRPLTAEDCFKLLVGQQQSEV